MAKLSSTLGVIAIVGLGLFVSGCAEVSPQSAAPPAAEGVAASAQPIIEVSATGLMVPGEPTVLWFWSPD